jgi:hypothetical protein
VHYHLVFTDASGRIVDVRSARGLGAADRETRELLAGAAGWTPTRYPGRSWRRGEIAVYMDRATSVRRELSVLRCSADHEAADLTCPLRALGIPALNLTPAAPAPTPEPDVSAPARQP